MMTPLTWRLRLLWWKVTRIFRWPSSTPSSNWHPKDPPRRWSRSLFSKNHVPQCNPSLRSRCLKLLSPLPVHDFLSEKRLTWAPPLAVDLSDDYISISSPSLSQSSELKIGSYLVLEKAAPQSPLGTDATIKTKRNSMQVKVSMVVKEPPKPYSGVASFEGLAVQPIEANTRGKLPKATNLSPSSKSL